MKIRSTRSSPLPPPPPPFAFETLPSLSSEPLKIFKLIS